MQFEYDESIELLTCLLLHSITEEHLRKLAFIMFSHQCASSSKSELINKIIATRDWSRIIDDLGINDFRVCSVCGALMHQGYCYDMGHRYYCSDECLHHDFTAEEWNVECKSEPQSYWTDWFEHYELTNKF